MEELKNNYKDMLADKENCIKSQKQELEQWYINFNELKNENDVHNNELSNIKIENNKQLEHLEGNLKDKNLIVEEYKNKNDMLLTDLAKYKKYKGELEEYKKLLADAQGRDIDKDNLIKDNEYNINRLNKNIEKTTQDNQKELEILKKIN